MSTCVVCKSICIVYLFILELSVKKGNRNILWIVDWFVWIVFEQQLSLILCRKEQWVSL